MKLKKDLYQLLDNFINNHLDVKYFTDQFYIMYDLEEIIDLNDYEEKILYELSLIISRYSPFQEDLENYPDIYCNDDCVKEAARKAYNTLKLEPV